MKKLGTAIAAATLTFLTCSATSAQDAAPVVQAVPITDNLYLLEGGGGANSSVLIGADGILVVDSKLDVESADAALQAIAGLVGKEDPAIDYLLNTHVHPDHTGGNERYGERGATIIAHREVKDILAAGQRGGPPAPEAALPHYTFGNGASYTLQFNGETVQLQHMPPAHTTDNSIVHFVEADVFHLGDLYSPIRYPVLAGGTLQGFLDGLDRILAKATENSRFIPGNGPVMGVEDLRAYREMLTTVRDRVAALAREGKSVEEVIAAAPTAEFDATWGAPDRFLPGLYRELAAGE